VARFFGLKSKKSGENIMAQEFLSDSTGSARPNSDAGEPEREAVDFMIIGSREGVMAEIRKFYAMGFAQVDEWSPLIPVPNSHRMMTILVRYRKVGSTDSSTRKSGR
jgi:alkanesulfonate monooxygenase SsuD/methylene tetrahydromethanopterin reductase-like flavin-dependent oxidoreductase (luciferase family)